MENWKESVFLRYSFFVGNERDRVGRTSLVLMGHISILVQPLGIYAIVGIKLATRLLYYYTSVVMKEIERLPDECGWPDLDAQKADPAILLNNAEERPVKVMFLSDTHLLGSRNGHWFDKLKREWQMYRAFQTAMTIHKPELVFILGDIFDEGLWCSSAEFDRYVARFNSLFYIPQNTQLYVVAGNHDMGFHYSTLNLSGAVFELSVMAWLRFGFVNAMNAPSVKRVSVRGNHFVLMNSMALEGDGCFLCKPTEMALNRIAKQLKCTKGIGSSCKSKDILKQYSKPILLQHYPMYRESDEICHEVDEAPANIKSEKFRERWECLSKEASEQVPFRHNGTETYSQWSHASWLQANSPRKYPRIHRSVFQLAQQKQSVVFTRCIHAEQLLGIKVLHACRNDGHRNIYNRFYCSIPLPRAQS
ncbi:metallophosphoesterase 1 isoform X3 [Neodiprion lecontei]|uniref:Metallophosphoesterase 1 isoform X3 n=1 Tax=Neodiprion lecontei TaxID=441921 RepID=A0ABM3G8U4_NEOLC|nr:metallophosphoesterase 1 isoform X3 [Neodiprion lecontei]